MNHKLSTIGVLRTLGFAEDPQEPPYLPGQLNFRLGPLRLVALECINLRCQSIVSLSGVLATGREISEIHHELPRDVESWEQGLALLTWCIDHETKGLTAHIPLPDWVELGRQYFSLLPWERDRLAYAARPSCLVDHAWARVALRKLADELRAVEDDRPVVFHFDGELLRIRVEEHLIMVQASGAPWANHYRINAGSLRQLPKRLTGYGVRFSVWSSALTIGNRSYGAAVAIDAASESAT